MKPYRVTTMEGVYFVRATEKQIKELHLKYVKKRRAQQWSLSHITFSWVEVQYFTAQQLEGKLML